MHAEVWFWFAKILAEFAILGVPASAILWYWKRRGVKSKKLNYASFANLASYLLWLTVVLIMLLVQETSSLRPLIDYRVPRYVFVVYPLMAALASFCLCVSSVGAESGERRFVSLANGLVLVLWACAVVAPN
jgi:hypothetical protein